MTIMTTMMITMMGNIVIWMTMTITTRQGSKDSEDHIQDLAFMIPVM